MKSGHRIIIGVFQHLKPNNIQHLADSDDSKSILFYSITLVDLRGTTDEFLPFYLYLSLDVINAVCHQFGLLGTDLHLYLVQVLSKLSTRASSSCSPSARAPISSANRRLGNISAAYATLPIMVFQGIRHDPFEKILNRVGDRRYSCLTPTVVLNHSPMLPFIWTELVALS